MWSRLHKIDIMKQNSFGIQRRWRLQASGTSLRRAASPPYEGPPPTDPQRPGSVKIHAEAIKFSGADTDYNPLYDRALRSKIEPPQWRKGPDQNAPVSEPISYVKGKRATVKLDISGSPKEIPEDRSLSVRVTPSAALYKQVFRKDAKGKLIKEDGELDADDAPGVDPYPITFTDPSETIQVTDWTHEDYEQLSFTTSAFPNTVRFDKLKITWKFEYRYNATDPWRDAGTETTEHETYITYDRSYEEFKSYEENHPWKEVLQRACSYAHGAATINETFTQVTTGIYNSLEFSYDAGKTHSDYEDRWIKLWAMLNQGWMDCMDGSNYWTILMQWLGINANQIKINKEDHVRDKEDNPIVYRGFYYKTLRPISTANDNAGWLVRNPNAPLSNWWNFHQVGIVVQDPDDTENSKRVYDPIIMVNRGNPAVPVEKTQGDYERALFDPAPFPFPDRLRRLGIQIHSTFPWADESALVSQVL